YEIDNNWRRIMKALITGGAGFIGSHLAMKFNNADIYDSLTDYYSLKLKDYNKKLIIQKGNHFFNKDIKYIDLSNSDYEYIFHLAAQPGVRYSVEHPIDVLKTNLISTLELLEKIRKSNIEIKRFVFISSSSVFGKIKYLPIDEEHPKNPISPYGASKLSAEKYVQNYFLHYGIPTVIIRPFTVVGARQRPDMGLHKFISSIIEDKPLVIYGDGNQTRDWTHIENIINGILLASKKKGAIGENFNIGNGTKISVNEVIDKINSFLNKKYKIINKPRNIADPIDTQADISKARRILGYNPTKNIDDAIKEQLNFYLNHRELFN
ncbi:MAG: GDP-mannose 4,6-dehydratase, partial [Candidatus Helarchaeota archaeon]